MPPHPGRPPPGWGRPGARSSFYRLGPSPTVDDGDDDDDGNNDVDYPHIDDEGFPEVNVHVDNTLADYPQPVVAEYDSEIQEVYQRRRRVGHLICPDGCRRQFKADDALAAHQRAIHGHPLAAVQWRQPCTVTGCPFVFILPCKLERHVSTFHAPRFTCPYGCSRKYVSQSNLDRHVVAAHGVMVDGPDGNNVVLPCHFFNCNWTFADESAIDHHLVANHKGYYTCWLGCTVLFGSLTHYAAHTYICHGIPRDVDATSTRCPYQCPHCPLVFHIVRARERHVHIAHESGLVRCCSSYFNSDESLLCHYIDTHLPKDDLYHYSKDSHKKRFRTDLCGVVSVLLASSLFVWIGVGLSFVVPPGFKVMVMLIVFPVFFWITSDRTFNCVLPGEHSPTLCMRTVVMACTIGLGVVAVNSAQAHRVALRIAEATPSPFTCDMEWDDVFLVTLSNVSLNRVGCHSATITGLECPIAAVCTLCGRDACRWNDPVGPIVVVRRSEKDRFYGMIRPLENMDKLETNMGTDRFVEWNTDQNYYADEAHAEWRKTLVHALALVGVAVIMGILTLWYGQWQARREMRGRTLWNEDELSLS